MAVPEESSLLFITCFLAAPRGPSSTMKRKKRVGGLKAPFPRAHRELQRDLRAATRLESPAGWTPISRGATTTPEALAGGATVACHLRRVSSKETSLLRTSCTWAATGLGPPVAAEPSKQTGLNRQCGRAAGLPQNLLSLPLKPAAYIA